MLGLPSGSGCSSEAAAASPLTLRLRPFSWSQVSHVFWRKQWPGGLASSTQGHPVWGDAWPARGKCTGHRPADWDTLRGTGGPDVCLRPQEVYLEGGVPGKGVLLAPRGGQPQGPGDPRPGVSVSPGLQAAAGAPSRRGLVDRLVRAAAAMTSSSRDFSGGALEEMWVASSKYSKLLP